MNGKSDPAETSTQRRNRAVDWRSRVREWFLLTGDRTVVVACLLGPSLVIIFGLLAVGVVAVTDSGALTRSFAALVGGNLTLITIVISINQLILSQEFGTPAELQDEIEEIREYRREAEETADIEISPIRVEDFFEFLVRSVRESALELREAVGGAGDGTPELEEEIRRYVETLVTETDRTEESTGEPPTEAFDALIVIMAIDFTRHLNAARRLRAVHGDSLSVDATESLDELVKLIEFVGVFRQYLESLYLQRELALLSRRLLYLGLPAIAAPLLMTWVYGQQGGAAVDHLALQVLTPLSAVVALAPLTFFFAYVVRLATVIRRTATLMPFKSRANEME